MTESQTRPSRRVKLLVAVLGPVVVLGLLEIGLRVSGYRYDPWAEWTASYDEVGEERVYSKDPELLWTLRPSANIDVRELGFDNVHTNALGLRGPELPGERVPGEIRVLCLGDSITFGVGLPDGVTWPEHCARALAAAPELLGRRVTVVNAGVPGWSSVQGMRQLEALRNFRPDVIVHWFGMNDAKAARGFPDSVQRPASTRGRKLLSALRSCRVFQLVQETVSSSREDPGTRVSLGEFEEAVRTLQEDERKGGPRVIFARTPRLVETTIRELDAVIARAEEVGATIVVGPFSLLSPWSPDLEGSDRVGTLVAADDGPTLVIESRGATSTAGIEKLRRDRDMLVAYAGRIVEFQALLPDGSLDRERLFGEEPLPDVLIDNCHLNKRGTRVVGEAMASAILRKLEKRR